MAYVNMTIDGQTKKTTQLNLVGADGATKTALLSAVIEASDQQGGGDSGFYHGEFVANRATEVMEFDADGASHFCIMLKGTADLTTGKAFFMSVMDDSSSTSRVISNNAGSNATTGSVDASGSKTSYQKPLVEYTATGVKLSYLASATTTTVTDTARWLQDGATYEWVAW